MFLKHSGILKILMSIESLHTILSVSPADRSEEAIKTELENFCKCFLSNSAPDFTTSTKCLVIAYHNYLIRFESNF